VAELAENLGRPLLPEQYAAVDVLTAHDVRGRFLSVEAGIEMPRQNGKSGGVLLPIILWSVLTDPDHFVWTAHLLDTSNKAFADLAGTADDDPGLIGNCDWLRRRVRRPSYENGGEGVSFVNGGQLDFRARSGRRGRGISGSTVVVDEALYFTDDQAAAMLPMLATRSMRGTSRAYYGSSAALAESAYLRRLRARAVAGDPSLSWVGWWARGSWADPGCARAGCTHELGAVGCALDDEDRWAEANPMLGVLTSAEFIRSMRGTMSPLRFGGEFLGWEAPEPAGSGNPISAAAWAGCSDPGTLDAVRGRLAAVLDVSTDEQHATLVVAGVLPDGRARVEVVRAWSGPACMAELARDLPGLVGLVRPRVLGWFPSGPAAAFTAEMVERRAAGWPPPGVKVEPIKAETPSVCMGFASAVTAGQVAQSDDPLLDAHVTGAQRLWSGDRWRFTRRGEGHCDGAYAAAGAVHLVRTMPSVGRQRLITGGGGRGGAS